MEEKIEPEIKLDTKPIKKLDLNKFREVREEKWEEAIAKYKLCNLYKEKRVIGISGHRFDKNIKKLAKKYADDYLKPNKDNIEYLISGGASGWDTEVLKHCFRIGIPFKIFLAFEKDLKRLPTYIKDESLETTWEKKKWTNPKDNKQYQSRNIKIVNESDELHVFLRKNTGGTINTINYAKTSKNIPIFNWGNITFIQVPRGLTDLTFAGYRRLYFNKILARFDEVQMKQNVYKKGNEVKS